MTSPTRALTAAYATRAEPLVEVLRDRYRLARVLDLARFTGMWGRGRRGEDGWPVVPVEEEIRWLEDPLVVGDLRSALPA